MKFFSLTIASIVLAGCGPILDRAVGTQTSVAKLRSDLGADINLRLALERDTHLKNAEVDFVSAGTYSCGPSNANYPGWREQNPRKLTTKQEKDRQEARISYLRGKYGDLAAILEYGAKLDAIITGHTESVASFTSSQTLVANAGRLIPSEFSPGITALNVLINSGRTLEDFYTRSRLVELAIANKTGLEEARARIVAQRIHKEMTINERKAFYDWDTCAIDRLAFLRAYRPGNPNLLQASSKELMEVWKRTAGEDRSSVIDFTAAVRKYLEEKEAFTSQLMDYRADIDAIVEANNKIASLPPDAQPHAFIDAVNGLFVDANSVKANYQAIRESIETKL
ncbi:hypothetical protein KQX63_10365 [Rhodopseudomonas palustris]|uniref:hypothetical protein n=1 Tax=Rhodopseudomonas palustris TaxID=1076 RepID=UPI0021F3A641|nr:hypothetical protein [Rhodopseudomonas palustris]UYO46379.1 hypothetical protein KQX63_10365 [Rhodopseudomonas palustris]